MKIPYSNQTPPLFIQASPSSIDSTAVAQQPMIATC